MVPEPLTLVVRVKGPTVPPPEDASDASEWARRLAPECVQLMVVAPAVATGLLLVAPVMPDAAMSVRSVCPLPAVNEPEFPLPTTSTTQAFAERVVMEVEIESAPLVSVRAVAASGAAWLTPVNETALADTPSTGPWKLTVAVCAPAAPRLVPNPKNICVWMIPVPPPLILLPATAVSATPL